MKKPAQRLRDYLLRTVTAYADGHMRVPRTADEAFAALTSNDFSYGPDWWRVEVLIHFLDDPRIKEVLQRELQKQFDRSFYAALLLALVGCADGIQILEGPPTLSASGIESGLALLARAALGKLDAKELERRLDRVPNARAFGL